MKIMMTFACKNIFIHVLVISALSFSSYEFAQQNSGLLVCRSLDCSEPVIFHFLAADSSLSTVNSSAILYLNSFRTLG